jgi:hypothetical protein
LEIALRGHLWVESVLNGLIEAKMAVPDALSIDRIPFAAKVDLAHALGLIDSEDVPWFRTLNKLRNRLAHTLGGDPTDEEVAALEQALSGRARDTFDGVVGRIVEGAHARLRSAFLVQLILMEYQRMLLVWNREHERALGPLNMRYALNKFAGAEYGPEKMDEWLDEYGIPPQPRPHEAFDPPLTGVATLTQP